MSRQEDIKRLTRAEVFLKVQCKLMTATQAAKQLGVSRKTYYEWEKKGIAALKSAFSDGQGGRPSQREDPQLQRLREQKRKLELENELLEMRLKIRKAMAEDLPQGPIISKSKGFKHSKKKK